MEATEHSPRHLVGARGRVGLTHRQQRRGSRVAERLGDGSGRWVMCWMRLFIYKVPSNLETRSSQCLLILWLCLLFLLKESEG